MKAWRGACACVASLALLLGCAIDDVRAPDRAAVAASASAAATSAAVAASAASTITPNPYLVVQGIPPIPAQVAAEVAKYTDFRGHGFVAWHPTKREMLVAHRRAGANTAQLFRVAAPLAEPEPLTDFADPVTKATYEPRDGRYVVFARARGGDEADQLYRLDLNVDAASRQPTLLTDPNLRHQIGGWLHRSPQLLVLSVPLDRTARGGTRAEIVQTLTLLDPLRPDAPKKLADLPGGGWGVGGVDWNDRRIALTRYLSADESEIWLLDLASASLAEPARRIGRGASSRSAAPAPSGTGKLTRLLPLPGATAKATHFAAEFARDSSGLFLITDRASEFRELAFYRFASRRLERVTAAIGWDVSRFDLRDDGRLLAVTVNVDGRNELRLFDAKTLKAQPPAAVPPGSIGTIGFHGKRSDLAFNVSSTQGPSQIHTFDPATGRLEPWTRAYAPPGVDTRAFAEQRIARWKSFDGRIVSGIVSLPPARFAGRRPVLISIHGGPEGQAKIGFLGRANYFIDKLGFAFIEPNVRGSSGYGKTYLALDNGKKREDSVKDIGALLEWIARQTDLDASRVAVIGGSYGGYMSLATATHYADRIAAAIDVVGISNFVSFLENTESYRRDLRRVEYGDERDPAMREFLRSISPLTHAARITKPLFVVQGKNDPRVPYTEAEQIVREVRANGTPVWYLRAENEGHGFARKENADFQFYATVMFLREMVLK